MWKPPTLVAAGSGAGKSFYFGAVLPSEMLSESKSCRIVTNIPIRIEAMAEFVASRSGQTPEEVADRIILMPREIEESWMKSIDQGGTGPWHTFEESGFDNTHFILDEAHHFFGPHHSKNHKAQWLGFVGDGVYVVSDRVEVLRRVSEAISRLETMGSSCWALQLYVVSLSDEDERDLGIDVTPKVNLAAVVAGASGGLSAPASGASALTSLDVTLRAVSRNERGSLLADPLLLLLDGTESRLSRGRQVPVRVTSVSQQTGSTVTNSQIQTVFSGLEMVATIKEVDDVLGRLKLSLRMGDMEGSNDGIPVVREETVDTQMDVVAGGVYLFASLRREQHLGSRAKWLQFGNRSLRQKSTLQVWGRVMRIGSPERTEERDGDGVPPGVSPRSDDGSKVEESGDASPVKAESPAVGKFGESMMP